MVRPAPMEEGRIRTRRTCAGAGNAVATPDDAMPPIALGFHCSHEQHAPSALVAHAKLAAEAGFTAAMCSDHFHPWSERQGHSGFAWSWLGAALEGTPLSFGTVCAPGQRYHPAVIAQAAATLAEMYGGRFRLAVGSGEALNEAITGGPSPSKAERNSRLEECAAVMRALWAGEAEAAAGAQWRQCALPPQELADLPTAAAFDRRSADASPEQVLSRVRASSDIERQLAWLQEDAALGFERIYLHNVARDHQERFIEACGTRLIPALAATR